VTGLASPIVEPDTPATFAAALRQAADQRRSVLVRGAGTKIDWGRAPAQVDLTLTTVRMNRLVAHRHGDLTATVEAGATLADLNRVLAHYRQCLPLDPPFADRATIGGILASNDSGPLRHRYGAPRDLVIGVEIATTDGTIAKSGGHVVKNVAGYDLARLMAGSFGSLAAIVTATFKLAPVPAASTTLAVEAPDFDAMGTIVRAVMASQLEPAAFDLHVPDVVGAELGPPSKPGQRRPLRPALLLRFASVATAVNAQIDRARSLAALKDCGITAVEQDAERALWDDHARRIWDAPGAVVRASWLPANIAAAMSELRRMCGAACAEAAGRAAVGTGLFRVDADARTQAGIVAALRRSDVFGNVVVLRGSRELKAQVDAWGPQDDREPLFASLKRALDPNGILNAGRGPL
jgi:glycolate oxidase FAD binding subunit